MRFGANSLKHREWLAKHICDREGRFLMHDSFKNGSDLLKSLNDRSFDAVVAGVVRASEVKDHISFSSTAGRTWTDIPVGMIRSAERLKIDRGSSYHPTMRIRLEPPSTAEGKLYLDLLTASMLNLAEHLDAVGNLPCSCSPSSIARDDIPPSGPSGTGAWCCKFGKAYACGCYPDGSLLICCGGWEPCTTMGPRAGEFSL